jgi:hypothetical protein
VFTFDGENRLFDLMRKELTIFRECGLHQESSALLGCVLARLDSGRCVHYT